MQISQTFWKSRKFMRRDFPLSRSAAGKYQLPYNTHKAGTADHPPPLSTPLVCAMNVMWLPVLAVVCSLLPGQIFVKCRKCDGVTVSISLPLYRSIIHLPNIYLPPPSLLYPHPQQHWVHPVLRTGPMMCPDLTPAIRWHPSLSWRWRPWNIFP